MVQYFLGVHKKCRKIVFFFWQIFFFFDFRFSYNFLRCFHRKPAAKITWRNKICQLFLVSNISLKEASYVFREKTLNQTFRSTFCSFSKKLKVFRRTRRSLCRKVKHSKNKNLKNNIANAICNKNMAWFRQHCLLKNFHFCKIMLLRKGCNISWIDLYFENNVLWT